MPVTAPPSSPGQWISVTFAGAWANFGSSYSTCQYRKDSNGVVYLKGTAKTGSGLLFTLPAGYRPPENCRFACTGSALFATVGIGLDGTVTPVSGDNISIFTLDGVSFLAA